MTTAFLAIDLSGSAPVAWWKQHLRVTRANCQHNRSYGGTDSSANNSVLCESAQWAKGDTTKDIHGWTAPEEEYSVASFPVECSKPTHLAPQIRITAKKQIWGPLLQQLGSRPHLWQGSHNHRTKERSHSISRAGSCHNNTNQTPYQGDKGTSFWTKLTHQGADTRSKRNYDPAGCGKETTNSKFDKMRWQRNML